MPKANSLLLAIPLLSAASTAAEYTIFIGDANPYQVARVVADSAGNTYIAGTRVLNESFQAAGLVPPSDIFIVKLDASGNTLFFRELSGQGTDTAADMAIDSVGNVYVGGSTTSEEFPLHNPLQSNRGPGFLLKLSADASELVWSTYFQEAITALAVDSSGNVYITGTTSNPGFPVTAGLPNSQVGGTGPTITGAFLTKIAAAGNSIVYSTVIAGSTVTCAVPANCVRSNRTTAGVSVAVDAAGNAYLAGNTNTTNLPATTGAFLASGLGAFAVKVKADGSALAYLTYFSATTDPNSLNGANAATAVACDAAGDAYLTGTTFDPNFAATKGALQTTYHGPATLPSSPTQSPFPLDAFALKLAPTGALVWATYVGGSGDDVPNAIAVDASNQVWLAGTTDSADFPNAQGWSAAGSDFISGLNASGSQLVYSARYPNGGASRSVSVDGVGLLHVSGPSGIVSTITPGQSPVPRVWGLANAANGPLDGRVALGEIVSIYGPHIGPATPVVGVPDNNGNYPTTLAGYQVNSNLVVSPIPLLYVSDSQINAVIPFSLLAGPVQVVTPSGATAFFPIINVAARPEIFHNPDGSVLALNQDGTLNAADHPALSGSTVTIWTTGAGIVNNENALLTPRQSGQVATSAINFLNDYCCGVQLGYNSTPPMIYAGTAPGSVWGVSQLKFQIPPLVGISPGPPALPLTIEAADGSVSRAVTLYVEQ